MVGDIPAFWREFWNNRPFYRPSADEETWSDVFSLGDLDDLLGGTCLRGPYLHITEKGRPVDPAIYKKTIEVAGFPLPEVPDLDAVYGLFAAGSSLFLKHLEHLLPKTRLFAADLALDLGHPIDVQGFVTPPGNSALRIHYDDQHLLILQLAGAKRWRIFENVTWAPVGDKVFDSEDGLSLAIAPHLRPGDFLYLPPGCPHVAWCDDLLSAHLTIVVDGLAQANVVGALVSKIFAGGGFGNLVETGAARQGMPGDPAHTGGLVSVLADGLKALSADEIAGVKRELDRGISPVAPLARLAAAGRLGEVDRWTSARTDWSVSDGVLALGDLRFEIGAENAIILRGIADATATAGTFIAVTPDIPRDFLHCLAVLGILTPAVDY
jgi:lysine-specific demethylase/histidyl-hydroxylase NO66